jgi:hypothetical protein
MMLVLGAGAERRGTGIALWWGDRSRASSSLFFRADPSTEGRRNEMTTVSEEHDRAAARLNAALAEQHRLADGYVAAVGTSTELSAHIQLHQADEQVRARDAWLKWVDDDGYRGLDAGPFDLRRDLEDALGPVR